MTERKPEIRSDNPEATKAFPSRLITEVGSKLRRVSPIHIVGKWAIRRLINDFLGFRDK